ncbi:hypothetical protein [Haloferax volcanii]|uniref:hypothetical protein n=1 Tax=Haloferax volcanii TaxID=2246 RepID=UPI00249B09AD|nr:hypothetical protein [Haloferax alexandrinus]WEL28583.1 hypothetical protein HBNXHx_0452 [Haloferax alexandrinus]
MSDDPNRHGDDIPDDEPTAATDSDGLVLETGDHGTVFTGAVLVGVTTYSAAHTLAVRAAGSFPDGGLLTAVLTLGVFATGVGLLVDGTAGLVAKRDADL